MSETLSVHASIDEISEASWDGLLGPDDPPFLRWAFLDALERSGCTARARWSPRHLAVHRDGRLVAAAPAYMTSSSQGDFSRDWSWADAAARVGRHYYPKLVVAIPFTPATGRRLLVAPGADPGPLRRSLAHTLLELAREEGCGITQVLFCTEEEARALEEAGLTTRYQVQFHWLNRGYADYEAWLATLDAKRRHQARRERKEAAKQGIIVRTVPTEELAADPRRWARDVHGFYRAHLDRLYWGRAYLNDTFFRTLFAKVPEGCDVVEASKDGRLVAGAFNLVSRHRLYGRHWGCHEEHPFLHFHVCFYHSIDACIRRGLAVFEGGMDGEHKLARGFEPVLTHSAHAFMDKALDRALRRALAAEREAQIEGIEAWQRQGSRRA